MMSERERDAIRRIDEIHVAGLKKAAAVRERQLQLLYEELALAKRRSRFVNRIGVLAIVWVVAQFVQDFFL